MNDIEKLVLVKPIKINGIEYKELTYDFENFTARDKMEAGKKYRADGGMVSVQELDSDYHLYLFAQAVAKVDKSVDITDILRLNAKDSTKAGNMVRSFFFIDSEENQESTQMKSSEEQ